MNKYNNHDKDRNSSQGMDKKTLIFIWIYFVVLGIVSVALSIYMTASLILSGILLHSIWIGSIILVLVFICYPILYIFSVHKTFHFKKISRYTFLSLLNPTLILALLFFASILFSYIQLLIMVSTILLIAVFIYRRKKKRSSLCERNISGNDEN